MADQQKISITERPNPVTSDIDVQDSAGIVRLLFESDKFLFAKDFSDGEEQFPGMLHKVVLDSILNACQIANEIAANENGAIVLSGAGTSGRLAYFATNAGNRLLKSLGKRPIFHYLIAGGDKALVTAQELQEDLPQRGVLDLKTIESQIDIENGGKILLIGISCGLSAPYVAGQLHYAMQHSQYYYACMLGFNPLSLARKTISEGFCDGISRSVAQVLSDMHSDGSGRSLIINPVVGPESIAGSTRMKGGSATKIILDILIDSFSTSNLSCEWIEDILNDYSSTLYEAYSNTSEIAKLVNDAGTTLLQGKHLYYVGSGSLGVLGFIDASEQVPTFGADPMEIRGFIPHGWDAMNPVEKGVVVKASMSDHQYRVSTSDFPSVESGDIVVILGYEEFGWNEIVKVAQRAYSQGASVRYIRTEEGQQWAKINEISTSGVTLALNSNSKPGQIEMAYKWVLNALTTGGHILKGKVYGNRMIDLRLSNTKLYERAIQLISTLSHADRSLSEECIIECIEVRSGKKVPDIPSRIREAVSLHSVVPVSLLMAISSLDGGVRLSVSKATEMLKQEPVIRLTVKRALAGIQQ